MAGPNDQKNLPIADVILKLPNCKYCLQYPYFFKFIGKKMVIAVDSSARYMTVPPTQI